MTNLNTLRLNPPHWLDSDELNDLPDAFTDKRELWEMVATCTPGSSISAHYSSLALRVVADWLECRIQRADVNGWNCEPQRLVDDLRIAAYAADIAIEDDEILPRRAEEVA